MKLLEDYVCNLAKRLNNNEVIRTYTFDYIFLINFGLCCNSFWYYSTQASWINTKSSTFLCARHTFVLMVFF